MACRKQPDNDMFFRFDNSNTDHVFSVRLLDRVTIQCRSADSLYEYSKLYVVSSAREIMQR